MRIRKYFRKNRDLLIRLYAAFSLVLNITFPLWTAPRVYAQEEVAEPAAEETVVEEEATVESTEEAEPAAEEAASEESEEPVVAEETEEATEPEGDILEEGASDYRPDEDAIVEESAEEENTSTIIVEESTESDAAEEDLTGNVCLSEDAEVTSTAVSDWEISGTLAETKDDVELGIRYEFPLDKDVTVLFTCLPKDESLRSNLKIERVDINDLELPEGYETDAPYAYDITTEMENGTFEYEFTLPKPEGVDAEIISIDKSASEAKQGSISENDIEKISSDKVEQDENKVVGIEQTHFSVKVPVYDVSSLTVPSEQQTMIGACMEDASGINLQCTANDVSIANVTNIVVLDECDSVGDTVTFTADWNVQSGANQRYDVGLYFPTEGQTNALNGECSVTTLANSPTPPQFDFDGDACGDIDQDTLLTAPITLTVECNDPDGDTALNLPYCVSWDNSDRAVCEGPADAVPGTPSKCNCQDGFEVGVVVPLSAHIEVVKDLVPASDLGTFNLQVNGTDEASCVGDSGSTGQVLVGAGTNVDPGDTHTVGESACAGTDPAEYVSSISCVYRDTETIVAGASGMGPIDVPVLPDDDIVCTVTNTVQTGTLTLEKTVINDNGGTLGISDFNLYIDGVTAVSGTPYEVSSDQEITVSEDPAFGYAASVWGGDCAADGTITVAPGQNATCTITNDDIQPKLTVTKVVVNNNGGTAVVSDFDLFVGATQVSSGVQNGFNAGNYVVSEENVPGYTGVISGDCDENGNVSLAVGQTKACTITNDDVGPTLTLHKVVINNNGGTAGINDFGLRVAGNLVTSGSTTDVDANTLISINEDGLAGYSFVSITGGAKCPAVLGGTVSLSPGENLTCTITNDDIQPKLTVTKIVVNDNGGSAQVSEFPLFVDDTSVVSGVQNGFNVGAYIVSETENDGYTATIGGDCDENGNVSLALGDVKACTIINDDISPTLTLVKIVSNEDGGNAVVDDFQAYIDGNAVEWEVAVPVPAGAHTASEDTLPGYLPGNWTGDCNRFGSVTLAPGENKTCTITNDDVAPKLTLVKSVLNNSGGNAQPNDFNLTIGGNPATSGVSYTLAANSPYAINETQLPGYSFVSITGDEKCPEVLGGTVTLDEGDDITCTITNDDVAPSLTVIKSVINDNGGNAQPNDFGLTVGGAGVLSGDSNEYAANTPLALNETVITGYSFVSITGDAECPEVLGGTVTLDEGDDITCTITNDDIAPSLTVIKEVINDNGGNALPDDFDLTVDEVGVLSGEANEYDANTPLTLNETVITGYTFVSITGDEKCPEVLGGAVTLDEGDDITCTITNDDVAASLTIIKNVINDNGGNADADDFDLTVGGAGVLSGESNDYDANTPLALNETVLTGYSFVAITGDAECPEVLGGTVTLEEGDDVTCTITNNDIAPELTVAKYVVNDNGGNATVDEFEIEMNNSPLDFDNGSVEGDTTKYVASPLVESNTEYTLSELDVFGYIEGSWICEDINKQLLNHPVTLSEGQVVQCYITNDDIAPSLTLVKNVVGGDAQPDDFALTVNDEAVLSGVSNNYNSNTPLAIDEGQVDGYSFTSITGDEKCPEVLGGTVTLGEAEEITCTITNTRDTGTIRVLKEYDSDGDGIFEFSSSDANTLGFRWGLNDEDNTRLFNTSVSNLETGDYLVDENIEDLPNYEFVGYVLGRNSCEQNTPSELPVSVDVLADQITVVTLCNVIKTGSLIVHKLYDSDADNIYDVSDEGANDLGFRWGFEGETVATLFGSEVVLPVGSYDITETNDSFDDYGFSKYSFDGTCTRPGAIRSELPVTVEVSGGQTVELTLCNDKLTSGISGFKWNDLNGNGEIDEEEPYLSGWTIFIDENENQTLDEGEEFALTQENGQYEFRVLFFGTYSVCEVVQDGWLQTYPSDPACHTVVLPYDGQEVRPDTNFGNIADAPELTVSKQNDTGGAAQTTGDVVLYTIVVTATESNPFNVVVTDLLPEGFEYIAGSWTANSSVRGDLKAANITTEPTYASPGDWWLDDMVEGEVVTLTYLAEIQNVVDAGTYKDLAWAQGENVIGSQILATAINPGFVDENFAGTDVTLELPTTPDEAKTDIEIDVEEISEVLGASTFLPATGSNTKLLYFAGLLFVLGLTSIGLALMFKKGGKKMTKVFSSLFAILVLSIVFSAKADAAGLTIRLEEPDASLNEPFDITFVALDIQNRPVTVECFVKKPGMGSFEKFGADINLQAGGDTDVCSVGDSVLTTEGTFTFKAVATAGGDTDESEEVSVDYDDEGPEKPKFIEVDEKGDCKWEIKIKTHADGGTDYIEVYASDELKYSTNDVTKIKTISIGPDEEVEFVYEVYGDDCGETLYFATRAFDSAGNASDVRNQEITETETVTTTSTTTETEVTEAIALGGSAGGSILGDEDATTTEGDEASETDEQGEGDEDGSILGEEDEVAGDEESKGLLSRIPWWIILIIILLGIFLFNVAKGSKKDQTGSQF